MRIEKRTHISAILSLIAGMTAAACSGKQTSFYSSQEQIRLSQTPGSIVGDLYPSSEVGNSMDSKAVAASGMALPDPLVTAPPKEGQEKDHEQDSAMDKLNAAQIGSCLESANTEGAFANYKVVEIEGKNKNNKVLYEDKPAESGELILLRVDVKNANHGEILLMNPKSTYCLDMSAKNINKFSFKIACGAKAGFIKLEVKNSNKLSIITVPAPSCSAG